MPFGCSVKHCKHRKDKNKELMFYSIPRVITHRDDNIKKLSEEQRNRWLEALGDIGGLQEETVKICSSHLITG